MIRKNSTNRKVRPLATSLVASAAVLATLGISLGLDQSTVLAPETAISTQSPSAVVVLPSEESELYATGEVVNTDWIEVWQPMCGSRRGRHGLTGESLAQIAANHHDEFGEGAKTVIVDTPPNGVAANFNVVFVLAASVPAAAVPAFTKIEQYLEAQFTDSITVTINVSFAALGTGILGATTPTYTTATYKNSRTGLYNNRDSNDTVQQYLPITTKIGVRYTGTSSTITQEDRVYWTRANYKSTIGTSTGTDASMQFSTAYTWDYDPTNAITAGATSFVDVGIHEVGHALGFICGAGLWTKDMSSLDLYRFQYSDGTADYNPDSSSEFTSRPRLVSYDSPNDSHIIDFVTAEYRMSDGNPYQASHLREEVTSLGLMDPVIAAGVTAYPNYFLTADLTAFDAIGWDR